MTLLERVAKLVRANLNDLIDQAEDPEKLLKQLLLDMQNQFMQLKTQTAMALAHQHSLESKRAENATAQSEWRQKAELALAHHDESLARAALDRSLTYETASSHFARQVEEQDHQVTTLRESLSRLESKMTETRTQTELLLARHRRARIARQTGAAALANAPHPGLNHDAAFERLRSKVLDTESLGHAYNTLNEPSIESQLETLEKNNKINRLLAELKQKQSTQS